MDRDDRAQSDFRIGERRHLLVRGHAPIFPPVTGITLHAGAYDATFRPDCAMLCTSIRHRWRRIRGVAAHHHRVPPRRRDRIPLLHPWANRLGRFGHGVGDDAVDLRGVDLPVDRAGLPLHGNLLGVPFEIAQCIERPCRRDARLRRASREAARVSVPAHRRRRCAACTPTAASRSPPRSRPDFGSAWCRSRSAGTRIFVCRTRRAASGSCAGPRASTSKSTNA